MYLPLSLPGKGGGRLGMSVGKYKYPIILDSTNDGHSSITLLHICFSGSIGKTPSQCIKRNSKAKSSY